MRATSFARAFNRSQFREIRFRKHVRPIISSIIDRKGSCTILDVGGDPSSWQDSTLQRDVKILILNIDRKEKPGDPRIEVIEGRRA